MLRSAVMPRHSALLHGAIGGVLVRRGAASVLTLLLLAPPAAAQVDRNRLDVTGRQNLTPGSGARAYGMGGAFLARADDATAASWNPAGLSYLRLPEISLVGNYNSFETQDGDVTDHFEGGSFDFAAFTWPISIGETRGAVQISYQRAISFDGTREIDEVLERRTEGRSDGGFDVASFGTGLRLTRRLRLGLTLNRWLNGYEQSFSRFVPDNQRPRRDFDLDFRPRGWSVNLGIMWSPIEELNVGGVLKTPFTADVTLEKHRTDYWFSGTEAEVITENAFRSEAVRLESPTSFGLGLSWRPRDTLTLSADFTRTGWSRATILQYFELPFTLPGVESPPPVFYPELPYPTLVAEQTDAEQIRVGIEYVLIRGRLKVPLRAGYFNDRQITADATGDVPRYNGVTVGTGIILGSLLLDVAYLHEFGSYSVTVVSTEGQPVVIPYSLKTRRVFASLIYRFAGRP